MNTATKRDTVCPGAGIALILFAAYATHPAGLGTPWSALLGALGHRAVTPNATARHVGLMAGERMAICPGAGIALILFDAYATHLAGPGTPWSALLGASGHRAVTPNATAHRVGLMAGERMAICPGASIALVLFAAYATHLAGAGTSWSALLGASGHQAVTPHATASLVMQRLRCECSSPPRRHDDRFLPPAPSAL